MERKEYKISFIENIQEITNDEMSDILGGATGKPDCACQCTIRFGGGGNCGCNTTTSRSTFSSCPCECITT